MSHDIKDFFVSSHEPSKKFFTISIGSTCPIIDSDDRNTDLLECMANKCSDCPYDLPDDIVPASEALFNRMVCNKRRKKNNEQ